MKKFFAEFRKFITRGNVVDMAVGVIVGSSFTAIVNGLSNFILKPIINWLLAIILGKDSLADIQTMLVPAYTESGEIDLASSIYIDWGAFINSVINFFLVAIVLFVIVRIFNRLREGQEKWVKALESGKLTREDRRELKARGVKATDIEAIKAYIEQKRARLAAEQAEKKALEEQRAKEEREANPTTEDLLKRILAELEKK